MPAWSSGRAVAAVVVAALVAALHAAPPDRLDPQEMAVRQLRKAVDVQRDGSHMVLLSSMRQLHDPRMTALFSRMTSNDDPGMQVHSVLALAELDPSHQVSLPLLASMKSPAARTVAIERAVHAGMISPEAMRALLAGEDLEPMARLWLLGRLVADRQPLDPKLLRDMTDQSIDIAGLASWLLAQTGDRSAIASYQERLAALPALARDAHLREIFTAMPEYKLTQAVDWAVGVLSDSNLDPDTTELGIRAVLMLDLKRGLKLWRQHLGTSPPNSLAVRYALLLLDAGGDVPASEFDRLPRGELLLDRLVTAGKVMGSGNGADALSALIDLDHEASSRWALRAAEQLPRPDAVKVYTHIISNLSRPGRGRSLRVDLALDAAARLFELQPDLLADLLSKADDDSLMQEAILIGLLATPSPRAGHMAASVKRLGVSRADSLALILLAKHAERLNPDDLRQLGLIASGGGKVSDALQAQAAWLYLRHKGTLDQAIDQVFAAS